MQDCVTGAGQCETALEGARRDLALCRSFLGEDPTPEGVLGGVTAALIATDVARVWWRRWHGPTGPLFPLDRLVSTQVFLC
jgi:hypothetical protein